MPLQDYVKDGRNKITIASVGVGLIVTTVAAIGFIRPAYRVETPDHERLWEVSTYGAIGTGTGATPFGNLGECLKSGGGSGKLMSWGTCGSGGGSVNTGAILNAGNDRFVNVSGDTMTGSLNILNGKNLQVAGTITGSILKAVTSLASSGTLTFEGAASGSSLYLGTSLKGAGLVTDCDTAGTSKLLWDVTTGRFSCGVDTDTDTNTTYTAGKGLTLTSTSFKVNDVFTGTLVSASNTLASSGNLIWEGNASGNYLVVSKGFSGAGLASCSNGTTSKLLWNSTTGRFSCGTDTDTDTNTTYTAGQGLTLNGTVFVLNASHSGTIIKAATTLASSGTLVFEGAASGASLTASTSFDGAGLVDCDLATQTLAWDASTKRYSCGTDSDTTYTFGQGLTTNGTLVTLTASHSGTVIKATTTLASSGTLIFEGAASGASLYIATSLQGLGLTDCDLDSQTLNWDATTGRFSCLTDGGGGTTYTAGQGLSLSAGSAFSLKTTITGSLVSFQTVSGAALYAKNTLSSSGSLKVLGDMSGATLNVNGTATIKGSTTIGRGIVSATPKTLTLSDYSSAVGGVPAIIGNWNSSNNWGIGGSNANSILILGNVTAGAWGTQTMQVYANAFSGSVLRAQNSLASSGTLVIEGTASGNALVISGNSTFSKYKSCNLDTDANGLLVCGTDADTNTTYTAGQGLTLTSTALSTNATLTGTMLRFLTVSGALVYGKSTLASSGTLVFEGAASGSSLYLGTKLEGAGLTDCDADNQTVAWDVTTGRFSCGDDDTAAGSPYTAGQGLALSAGNAFSLNTTITGALLEFTTVSGALTYGKNTVASSGSLVWETAASGATLYVATSINGAGLTDCDLATQTVAWDSSTGRFSCGTDSDTTYTAGQGLTLSSTSLKLSATITGTLVSFQTVSGSALYAKNTLTSSGTLKVLGSMSGNSLTVNKGITGSGNLLMKGNIATKGAFSGANLTIMAASSSYILGNVTIGTSVNNGSVKLGVAGTISGSTVYATSALRSSGSVVAEGTISGAYVTANEVSPRWFQVQAFSSGSSLASGSGVGAFHFQIPVSMSGWNIVSPQASVDKAGVTNTTTFQLRDKEKRRKILSTTCSIDSTESGTVTAAAGCTIDTAADDVGGGDHIYLDIPSVSTTAPKGLNFMFGLRKP